MNKGIFICHRRADTAWAARSLKDRLSERFSSEPVFIDVDAIDPGVRLRQAIPVAIEGARIVLVLIGPNWLAPGKTGKPRLSEHGDVVAEEIERALACPDLRIIPVLVDGAKLPDKEMLPDHIRSLCEFSAAKLNNEMLNESIEYLANRITKGSHRPRSKGWDLDASIPSNSLGLRTDLFRYPLFISFIAFPFVFWLISTIYFVLHSSFSFQGSQSLPDAWLEYSGSVAFMVAVVFIVRAGVALIQGAIRHRPPSATVSSVVLIFLVPAILGVLSTVLMFADSQFDDHLFYVLFIIQLAAIPIVSWTILRYIRPPRYGEVRD